MIRRNRTSASSTDRARRIRHSAAYEDELQSAGHRPDTPRRPAVAAAPASSSAAVARRRGPSIKVILGLAVLLLLIIATVGGILLWQRVAAFNDSVSTAPGDVLGAVGPAPGRASG